MSGRFVWYDLATNDVEKSKAFYTALFGWTIQTMEGEFGTYHMWHNAGNGFGGITPIGPEQQGTPPHWLSYLQAPGKIEEMVAKATELGANVIQPVFDIPTIGKMAIIADPQGAVVAPFETAPMDSAPEFPPPGIKGGISWNELITTDPVAAASFYSAIGGFTSSVLNAEMGSYTLLNGETGPLAGVMELPPGAARPAWMIYFEIVQSSMEEALAEATRLGGQIGMGPMEVPNVGTIAAVGDPTGAWFCLMKSAPVQAETERRESAAARS
jgi:predicted enzyme related to lactoylglutathione lyase